MRRLAFKLPTAFQFNASYAVLFHEGGVTQITNLDNPGKYLPIHFPANQVSHRIWVLIDINPNLPQPAPIFRYGSSFFAVCTISPSPLSKSDGWINKIGRRRFYMNPWSILEVVQVYVHLAFGGSHHSFFVVALSSVKRSTRNVSSPICSIGMARPSEPWLWIATIRNAKKLSSSNASVR